MRTWALKDHFAERDQEKIVVEVKSFVSASQFQDLKEALGKFQYDIYPPLLEESKIDRKLYVAISALTYNNFFQRDVIQLIIKKHQLPMIIVDTELEEILQWIE